MKRVIAGDGTDSTSAVQTLLSTQNFFFFADLYLIGDWDDPAALRLTSYDSDLIWPPWGGTTGKFQKTVISRGKITSNIGLEVESLDVTWSPQPAPYTNNINTTSPYQLAQVGYYDQMDVRIWKAYMPQPGDCMTLGCSQLWGGRIANVEVERASIKFTVNSWLEVANEMIPNNVIQATNQLAAYVVATPPTGLNVVPQFNTVTASSVTVINGDAISPTAHQIFDTNEFAGGYLVFNKGTGNALGGYFSAIQQNTEVTIGGGNYNQFILNNPLPWPPTAGVDTFYVSSSNPSVPTDGSYYGFPYVPSNVSAV